MKAAAKWYRRLTRFNTIAFTIVLILGLVAVSQSIYWGFSGGHYSEPDDAFGRASMGRMPISGEEIPVRGATFVKYFVTDSVGSHDWANGTNITIVDTRNGKSHKILSENDPRSLVTWELIYRNNEDRQAYAYLAWAATKEMEAQGRADLLIAGLPDLKQYTLAKNVRFADAPQVHGNNSIAMIIWRGEAQAELVVFDLGRGEIVQRAAVDLPEIPENLLKTSSRPLGDPLRQEKGDHAAPAMKYH